MAMGKCLPSEAEVISNHVNEVFRLTTSLNLALTNRKWFRRC